MTLAIKTRFVLLALLSCSVVSAGTTGKITGRITDAATREGLLGVNVTLVGTKLGAATDPDGYYALLNVPPGVYTLKISIVGYAESRVTGVRVSIDFTSTQDITMKESAVIGDEVVTVAERPFIRKDLTSSSATVSAEEIRTMPVESFQDILQLQAGVVVGSGGEIHVRGGRSNEVAYLIDGISVTDPYSGDPSIQIGSEAIQELKFVSGTFNAEYGQVMSGVVDIVTKDGGQKLSGKVSAFTGDYASNHSGTFLNIGKINPTSIHNVQMDLSGPFPIVPERLHFLVSARYDYNNGWLYGQRVFLPSDSSNLDNLDPSRWDIQKSGDGAIVPMNDSKRLNLQGKLTFSLENGLKLSYNGLYSGNRSHGYNHLFKYDPSGIRDSLGYGYTHIVAFTHLLNPTTFYTVKFSTSHSDIRSYTFENPFDPRYVDPRLLYTKGAFSFHTGGTDMGHFYRKSDVALGKLDFTSQINRENLVRVGVDFQWNKLWMHEYQIQLNAESDWKPVIPPITSYNTNEYTHEPILASAYAQDKIEVGDIVLNLGVRYDYFNSRGLVPIDPRDPNGSLTHVSPSFRRASAKNQVSPRLGLAFPITERGVIHFSYGHFFQIPPYYYLYADPEFEVIGGNLTTIMGNADLKPQKTVIYEVGLQQQLFENIGLDITGFYKDLRNLTGTEVHELYTLGDTYARYVNLDYGNVRGITLAVQFRLTQMLSGSVDYTYQITEGNASDPAAQFYNRQSTPPREDEVQVLPLDWDQTHTLNFSINVGDPSDWTVGLIGRIESGLPYTPEIQNIRVEFQNSGRKPSQTSFDLKLQKVIPLYGFNAVGYVKVYNLFDTRNENTVYLDTGRSGYTLVSNYAGDVRGINTLADFLNRPDWYSEPRKVLVGLSIEF
jgi:hypothetical protein